MSTLEPSAFRSESGPSALHQALEDAHAELRRAGMELERLEEPTFDPVAAARAIERALRGVFDVFDGRGAPVDAALNAMTAIDEALEAAKNAAPHEKTVLGDKLVRARTAMNRVMERLATPALPRVHEPSPLRASIDLPRLHVIARASIVAPLDVKPQTPTHAVVLPAAVAQPKTFAELQEAVATLKERGRRPLVSKSKPAEKEPENAKVLPPPAPGFAREVDQALDEIAFLRDRTRTCFEEVAMVGMQRAPLLGDPWRGSLLLERRMLASIDLVAAIGAPAIEHIPRLVADAPIKDASRAFAVGMILGCFAGRDALAAAERSMFSKGELDPAFVWELGAALSIAPHDLLALSLRTLLREEEPLLRAMAIDVLGHRNLATKEELIRAASDEPVVAARALVHLAISFGLIEDTSIDRALSSDDTELREAALCAVALHGDSRARMRLFEALDGPSADVAALYLAIAGDERDAQQLLDRTRQTPTPALVGALGWAGAASAIASLFELLEHERTELNIAAAWALERITGAGLWEEAEVPAEEIDVPEPPTPDVGEKPVPKLAKIISDPRDEPDKPAMDVVEQPTTDVARWRAYWNEHGMKYDLRRRYRMGQPYTPLMSLRELDVERRTPSERRLLQRELIIRTGTLVRLDPRDFVQVQEQALRDWQAPARAGSNTPGAWVRPERRRS